jgi:cell division protein FtsL
MGRLCFFVATVLMLSAISLVTARYQARQLYVELDRSRTSARDLDITWRQLQLDRAEHARNAHVDRVARESLKMISIVPEKTIYINQPGAPAVSAPVAVTAPASVPASTSTAAPSTTPASKKSGGAR